MAGVITGSILAGGASTIRDGGAASMGTVTAASIARSVAPASGGAVATVGPGGERVASLTITTSAITTAMPAPIPMRRRAGSASGRRPTGSVVGARGVEVGRSDPACAGRGVAVSSETPRAVAAAMRSLSISSSSSRAAFALAGRFSRFFSISLRVNASSSGSTITVGTRTPMGGVSCERFARATSTPSPSNGIRPVSIS